MTNERVIEVPWALMQLPQSGLVLDVGSCDATYLRSIAQPDRVLHCMDPRDCGCEIPEGISFFHDSIIGNRLPRNFYDAALVLSVMEHIGLPCYGEAPFINGDRLAVAELWDLLKPGGRAIVTVPAGKSKITSWYRQYTPGMLKDLFQGWHCEITYWGFDGKSYVIIDEAEVESYDYRDTPHIGAGSGALAGVVAIRP